MDFSQLTYSYVPQLIRSFILVVIAYATTTSVAAATAVILLLFITYRYGRRPPTERHR